MKVLLIFFCFTFFVVNTLTNKVQKRNVPCLKNGIQHPSGSNWTVVPCMTCHCYNGVTACTLSDCPRPRCSNTALPEGTCCPVCIDDMPCKFEGKTYAAHQQWQYVDEEPCIKCSCRRGETTCVMQECPRLDHCDNPVVPHGECCPQCPDLRCLFRGLTRNHGDLWKEDDCLSCKCDERMVMCSMPKCKETSCFSPVVLPGQCCPLCPKDVFARRLGVSVIQFNVRESRRTVVKFKIQLAFEKDDQNQSITITGNNLWRIRAWFSGQLPRENLNAKRVLETDQLLTAEQSSVSVINGRLDDVGIVTFNVNATQELCDDLLNMCVSFDTVQSPQIASDQAFFLTSLPSRRRLTACRKNWHCMRQLAEN